MLFIYNSKSILFSLKAHGTQNNNRLELRVLKTYPRNPEISVRMCQIWSWKKYKSLDILTNIYFAHQIMCYFQLIQSPSPTNTPTHSPAPVCFALDLRKMINYMYSLLGWVLFSSKNLDPNFLYVSRDFLFFTDTNWQDVNQTVLSSH